MAFNKYIFKKVSLLAYLFLCLNFSSPLLGQDPGWQFNESEEDAYRLIISLQLDKATPLLHKDRPASLYLSNLSESIHLIITEDASLVTLYEKKRKERLSLLNKSYLDSPYKRFYEAEIHLHSAFINLKMGNDWTAAWDFRRAYKLIVANTERYPDFLPNYKSMGLLHVMVGSVPEQYTWLLELLSIDGSVAQGMEEIKTIASSDHMFNLEAKAVHNLLQTYLLNESDAAIKNFKSIYDNNQDNLLFGYLYMSLLTKNAQSGKALEIYEHLKTLKEGYLDFTFLNYLVGEIHLQKGEYLLAESYLSAFIEETKGENFVKDAYYKLFLAYWLSDRENKALKTHQFAQKQGKTQIEADKHAAKSLSLSLFPNKNIMKIRLATDGGFYNNANHLIHQPQVLSSKQEKVEFIYRKARLYHKTGDLDKAIEAYIKAIDDSSGETWYFAPNSCLQLGYIYAHKKDDARAKFYFNQVLGYKNHEYKTSLDNKAKTALAAYTEQ